MKIKVIDYQAKNAAEEFAAALKEIGFAVIANHPVEQRLIDQVYAEWGKFFQSDEKYQYAFDPKKHDGYISQERSETAKGYEIKDIKEFFHYYSWGRCPANLKDLTANCARELTKMAQILLQWIEDYSPEEIKRQFSEPLSHMIEDSDLTLFRPIHYPPLKGNEPPGAIRAAAHEDINLLTVLPAATAKGLQVQNSDGKWLDVPCDKNWLIINTGDMLQECSQGYYPATTHRVINPEGEIRNESRLSMPLFLHPRDEVRLSERHTAGSYRRERYEELGLVSVEHVDE